METSAPVRDAQEQSGILRFTVAVGLQQVTALLSESVWQARHGNWPSDANLLEIYQANQSCIDAAVVRKVEFGARQPVVLRSTDL
jgi:hypothetical protein